VTKRIELTLIKTGMEYFQIDFTLDKKVRGRYEMPHTIEITSKEVSEYIDQNLSYKSNCESIDDVLDNLPEPVVGKLLKRKDVVDYMDYCYDNPIVVGVVSSKFKQVIESLQINKNEYRFKELKLKNFEDSFYLFLVPMISETDIVFPECLFWNEETNEENIRFDCRESWAKASIDICLRKVVVNSKCKNNDIISPRIASVFFSERIIRALENNSIVGFDVIPKTMRYSQSISFHEE